MNSRKYNRTFHFDFSPGTTSDDRINYNWWNDMKNKKNYNLRKDGWRKPMPLIPWHICSITFISHRKSVGSTY